MTFNMFLYLDCQSMIGLVSSSGKSATSTTGATSITGSERNASAIPTPVTTMVVSMFKAYYKLLHHQRSQAKQFATEDVALSPKDFPFLTFGDVISVHNPEECQVPRLLLKLTKGSLREDFIQKDAISIEQSLASTFQLKPYTDVIISSVRQSEVELDSLEVTFRDQYFGRSEMWRLKMSLVDTGVYLGKKIEFCSATIRCQVHEMWCAGHKVASGIVSPSTKIVFRSSTSMVYVFLQMSSEMWEFDIYGDLYFEKAVNGFLAQLFSKWKKNGSNHEVTIVLFSRVYYEATSLESFPEQMRECLQMDYKGKYYEDSYRVAVQNEKYEDWGSTLIFLRHIFVEYQNTLLNFHKKTHPNLKIPKGTISSAAQGNFLEVLNMSLNVFEKHFLDRSFDRTGQLSVVITPGVGVFEVDRELANVTMQRIIDNGVGSDLVCIGEQPLHAVPLLKFHNKASQQSNVDDYSMPHWINLSFYSTHRKVGYASYIPRIRLPTKALLSSLNSDRLSIQEFSGSPILGHCHFMIGAPKHLPEDTSWSNSTYDFDDYDDKVFKFAGSYSTLKKKMYSKKSPMFEVDYSKVFFRQNSEPEMNQATFSDPTGGSANNTVPNMVSDRTSLILPVPSSSCSSAITIPTSRKLKQRDNFYSSSFGALNIESRNQATANQKDKWFDDLTMNRNSQTHLRSPESSYGGSPKDSNKITPSHNKPPKEIRKPGRALINPFDPSHVVIKLTSNRRRWTHIFPRGPTGNLIQQHHFQTGLEIVHEGETTPGAPGSAATVKTRSIKSSVSRQASDANIGSRTQTLLWGATGEQEWTPALTTGVDWKSLTIPACLPLTTDYFPDDRSLQVDYLVSDYSLLPDDVNADYSQQRAVYRRPLNTKEVFVELVSQRLAQGFQLVIRNQAERSIHKAHSSTLVRGVTTNETEISEEYLLSIGRIFHRIKLMGSTITVTRYRPRHPYPSINVSYQFRFAAPGSTNYENTFAEFTTEKLENYNWNYLDHYVCTRGDPDFALTENLKYWRFRMLILPTQQGSLKRNNDEHYSSLIQGAWKVEETSAIVQDFLKFIETCINRIRRPNNSFPKGTRGSSGGSQGSVSSVGGFRERVNSNKITERPRMRSGSKLMEKSANRPETGSGRVSPLEGPMDMKLVSTLSDPFIDLQNPLPAIDQSSHECIPQELKLKPSATRKEIVAAMRSPKTGFSLIKSSDLPPWTFVSYDAVIWLMNHMEGITSEVEAVTIFNGMLNEGLILHASGDVRHPFMFGFYLYYIVIVEPEGLDPLRPHGDCSLFHNEWMEVEVPYEYCFRKHLTPENSVDSSNLETNVSAETKTTVDRPNARYKVVYVDVDVGKKSDRQEWGHVKYQSVYKPDEAFELTLQWMQSTGAIVADLVQGWSRKAQQCNLQLVPIPNDLFDNSDSLRGPTFIPLKITALFQANEKSNKDIEWSSKLFQFQQHLLQQFGFLRCYLDRSFLDMRHLHQPKEDRHLFVHSSGNIFVLIPQDDSLQQTGYLWSCNYMVSKRWRTSSTPVLGDESYMQSVLKEFREHCANQDNRLVASWQSFV